MRHHLPEKSTLQVVTAWVISMLTIIIVSLMTAKASPTTFSDVERITSLITIASIFALGLNAAFKTATLFLKEAMWISIAYASIFACYFGYVTIDFGSQHPQVAAIGFNIATILQTYSVWRLARVVYHTNRPKPDQAQY